MDPDLYCVDWLLYLPDSQLLHHQSLYSNKGIMLLPSSSAMEDTPNPPNTVDIILILCRRLEKMLETS